MVTNPDAGIKWNRDDILSKHIMNGVHQRMKNKSHCMERDTYRQESHKNASHGKYSDNI